jgi:hypothetical protein
MLPVVAVAFAVAAVMAGGVDVGAAGAAEVLTIDLVVEVAREVVNTVLEATVLEELVPDAVTAEVGAAAVFAVRVEAADTDDELALDPVLAPLQETNSRHSSVSVANSRPTLRCSRRTTPAGRLSPRFVAVASI